MALRGPARIQPFAEHSRRQTQENNGQTEDPAEIGKFPIRGVRTIHPGKRLQSASPPWQPGSGNSKVS